MILIKLSEDNYEYDVQSLVRAFYHGEDIVVQKSLDDTDEKDTKDASMVIIVDYRPEKIVIAFYEDKNEQGFGLNVKGRVLTIQDEIKVDYSDRPDTKNRLKKLLYILLCRRTKRELPWGTLTGIRPIKIPLSMLEQGKSEKEIEDFMHETYRISQKKIDLSMEIAKRELKVIAPIDYKSGYSLYIGIPFCKSTCAYCSFTSYPLGRYSGKVDAYLDALCKEIQYVSKKFKYKRLDTIYIGGGTPTTLEPDQLQKLFDAIHKYFDVGALHEFTIEAGRPDTITEAKLQVILKNGITRISINPQTMHDETLKLIGRHHTSKDFLDAFAVARKCGFQDINTDLILGLPDEHFEDVKKTLHAIFKLDPENITVHSLALKRAARLNRMKEQYANCYFENDPAVMDWVTEECKKHGYHPYYLYRQKNMTNNLENIGFAKKGKEGYYNILIMEEKQTIVGVGAGAVTKFVFFGDQQVQKVDNVKDVDLYISDIDKMITRKDRFIRQHFSKDLLEHQLIDSLPEHIAHAMNVSNLAFAIAKEYGLPEEQCRELATAGILHDIGKLSLFHYLYGDEQESLNIEQMRYRRMHSKLSYDILKDRGFSDFILESVLYHHECNDGTGFPEHLQGDEIPIGARILHVCDVFTALLSKRAYRDAFDAKTAMKLMIEEARDYDIKVFLAFMRVIHEIDMKKITLTKEDVLAYIKSKNKKKK